MNIYQKFKEVALNNKDKIALFDVDKNEKLTYEEMLNKINVYENKLVNSLNNFKNTKQTDVNFPCFDKIIHKNPLMIIYLKKGMDLIIWQLVANKNNLPFVNIEEDIRLNQILEKHHHYFLIKDNNDESLNKKIEEEKNFKIISSINDELKPNNILPFTKYIVFSSGSTGNPKQIMLNDEGVVNVVLQQAKILNIKNFLWLLNSAFDASLSDIYATLLTGETLFITKVKPNEVKKVCSIIEKYNITHTDLPPVTLPLFLKYKHNHVLKNMKIIIGGELVNSEICKELKNKLDIEFYNAYGPSENTICAHLDLMDEPKRISDYFSEEIYQQIIKQNNKLNDDHYDEILNNIKLFNLSLNGFGYALLKNKDEDINSKTFELFISGNVMNGYDNLELNKEKILFLYDNDDFIQKTFRTGDVVSIENNNYGYYIAYEGRKDRQFKYNGKLISPEEIEEIAMLCGAINAKVKFENKKIKLIYQDQEQRKDLGEDVKNNIIKHKQEEIEKYKNFDKEKFNHLIPNYMKPIILEEKNTLEVNSNFKLKR